MRTVVLLLMIALLPLRMWAGEAMGVRMAMAELPVSVAAADIDTTMSAMDHGAMAGMGHGAMPDDCPMSKPGADGAADKSGAVCLACHLSAAPAPLSLFGELHAQRAVPPRAASVAFASAHPSRERKPPIS